jgi:hypothetical protein
MKQGNGEYWFRDGSVFKGVFFRDLKHGFGEKIGSKISYSGEYVNGQKHGLFRFKKASTGEIRIVEYKDNKVIQRKENSKIKNGNILKKNIKKSKKLTTNKKQKINKKLKELKILNTHYGNPLNSEGNKNNKIKIIKSNSPPKFRPSRFKRPLFLSVIKEESETSCSVISDEFESPCLFFENETTESFNISKEVKYKNHQNKLRSGENLVNNKMINPILFQFKTENEFESFNLNEKKYFSKDLELKSTIYNSTEDCEKSTIFVFDGKSNQMH